MSQIIDRKLAAKALDAFREEYAHWRIREFSDRWIADDTARAIYEDIDSARRSQTFEQISGLTEVHVRQEVTLRAMAAALRAARN